MKVLHGFGCVSAVALCALVLAGCASTRPADPSADRAQIEARAQALLNAYEQDDQAAVIALVDTENFTIYGSDVSEYLRTTAGLRQMMTDDFKLWRSAKFGKIQNLDIRVGRDLATAFFNVPFSVGGRPPVMVRLATVWRRVSGVWLLTQSANSMITVGSSARELLKH